MVDGGKYINKSAEDLSLIIKLSQSHNNWRLGISQNGSVLYRVVRRRLNRCRQHLTEVPRDIISLIPASVWIFDNYHLLYHQMKDIKPSLLALSARKGPKVSNEIGNIRKMLRIEALTRGIVNFTDGRVEEEKLILCLNAYQTQQKLTSEELNLLPYWISLVLLERLTEKIEIILKWIDSKQKADCLMDDLEEITGLEPEVLLDHLAARKNYFDQKNELVWKAHIIYRIRKHNNINDRLIKWLTEFAAEDNVESENIISSIISTEEDVQSKMEREVSGLIMSLKALSTLDWSVLFEKVSCLEKILSQDPALVYSRMNAESRSHFRQKVIRLAKKHKLHECQAAQLLIEFSRLKDDVKEAHIGFALFGHLEKQFRKLLSSKDKGSLIDSLKKDNFGTTEKISTQYKDLVRRKRVRAIFYFGTIFFLFIAFTLLYLLICAESIVNPFQLTLITVIGSFLILGIAIEFANYIFHHIIKPKPIISMDYEKEIPENAKTFIVIPVIFKNEKQVSSAVKCLEKHYLANPQKNLCFAILGDLADSAYQSLPSDDLIIDRLKISIEMLNKRYSSGSTKFYGIMRKRTWNNVEQCWMGWERKRGKIEEFNAWLRGQEKENWPEADISQIDKKSFEYVITLDLDTELVKNSAAHLIGIMDHPLNRPVLDSKNKKLKNGYAIMQSAMKNRLASFGDSRFSRIFSNPAGIDPYSTVSSDIYQDTFNEGIYVGKGIYNIDAMRVLLENTLPENHILSHDLIESCYAKCAFVSNVQLIDRCPSHFLAYMRREHRWIRGDWQLIPWILGFKPINLLSRWKMFDNIRRSLNTPLSVILLVLHSWFQPESIWITLLLVLFPLLWRQIQYWLTILFQKILNPAAHLSWLFTIKKGFRILLQDLFCLAVMPYRALNSLDASARAIFRLIISHKNLLQWQTADSTSQSKDNNISIYILHMMPVSTAVSVAMIYPLFNNGLSPYLLGVSLLPVLWFVSPFIAWLGSRQGFLEPRQQIDFKDEELIMDIALDTWHYFAEQADQNSNWLAPDNWQLKPGPKKSDKTSPTNIGMQLLSIMAANDLGFIGVSDTMQYCEDVLTTIQELPRYKGHLYNWYNINTLEVLHPDYISTVDSGNFIGCLLALRQGLKEISHRKIVNEQIRRTLGLLLKRSSFDELSDLLRSFSDDYSVSDTDQWRRILREILIQIRKKRKAYNEEDFQGNIMTSDEWLTYHIRSYLEDCELYLIKNSDISNISLRELASADNKEARETIARIDKMIIQIDILVNEMKFDWLYDFRRNLFHIGFHVSSGTLDAGYYDLLASEARLASFLAIAKNDIPSKHWFRLGRPLTMIRGMPSLVSWSGSLFEYLLPDLLIHSSPDSITGISSVAAVRQQIRYAMSQKIPWGISESQYYKFDHDENYQYRAFGVNKLRLQSYRQPARVVAPYATLLALSFEPLQAVINLRKLIRLGMRGVYGLFEAVDFTSVQRSYESVLADNNKNEYTQRTDKPSVVESFMAHHLGMSLVSIDNFFNGQVMQKRFHSSALVSSAECLLEETLTGNLIAKLGHHYSLNAFDENLNDEEITPRAAKFSMKPDYHILANSRYKVLIDANGEGFSQYDDIRINRWSFDRTGNRQGQFIYLKDLDNDKVWSCTAEPLITDLNDYKVLFSINKAEFSRVYNDIMSTMEIVVAPQDSCEVRRVNINNHSSSTKRLEITSYLEPVITTAAADQAHPAYSKLFTETEYVNDRSLLICKRRSSSSDSTNYVFHQMITHFKTISSTEYEIDRNSFIGREYSLINPLVMQAEHRLESRQGFSPDPVLSLRTNFVLAPGQSITVSFITGYADARSKIMKMSYLMKGNQSISEIFSQSLNHARLKLKYLGINSRDYNKLIKLLSLVYDPRQSIRGSKEILSANKLGQQDLWRFGISGDRPIMLVCLSQSRELSLLEYAVDVYELFMANLVDIDFVIVNEEKSGYRQELDSQIHDRIAHLKLVVKPGMKNSLFVINSNQISSEEKTLLLSFCCINFNVLMESSKNKSKAIAKHDSDKELNYKVNNQNSTGKQNMPMIGEQIRKRNEKYAAKLFWNGFGYFSEDGKIYQIMLDQGISTPRPWSNVVSNNCFGFHITENGAGYTWADNSQANKLTVWSNDPVINGHSECIWIKDKKSGFISSPFRIYPESEGEYTIQHGFGYSSFENTADNVKQNLTVTIDCEKAIKLWKLNIKNLSHNKRSFSAVLYVSWVLGENRNKTLPYIDVEYDSENTILMATNRYKRSEEQKTAFLFSGNPIASWTSDQSHFLGYQRNLVFPHELYDEKLSQRDGSGKSPCGAIQIDIDLDADETKEILFGLGYASDKAQAADLKENHKSLRYYNKNFEKMTHLWQQKLGKIQLTSQDKTLDTLFNGWLLYQVICCRIKSRAAFYQCGGAYGFRDQLQDCLALLNTDPDFVRQHIIKCASRQFREGDVQHWWHDDTGVGVRTRISDDLLWLPYVLCSYVEHTGDHTILDEQVSWLEGPMLNPDEHDRAFIPSASTDKASIYEHAIAAISQSLWTGSHGLPLIGGGDWNDGMNMVGVKGKGESVWLGWFLLTVMEKFAYLCQLKNDDSFAEVLHNSMEQISENIEKNAWDGQWYLRGWFDNGDPLGSKRNLECRIDSLSQSWAVISGKADPERVETALDSADRYLVKDNSGVILLLNPPFDGLGSNPGYISNYIPGVRENGGQYTHAAVWLAIAYAKAGKKEQASHLINMLNPINHTATQAEAAIFQTEPYVLPADVYYGDPYTGRGGWSWYTGSASWYYRAILNYLIGINFEKDILKIDPVLPDAILPLTLNYKYKSSQYQISMKKTSLKHPKAKGLWLDQVLQTNNEIKLEDDGKLHKLIVYIE